ARLQRADDAGEDAEHAALGAARGELRRRRLREQAAIARSGTRLEHGRLTLEAIDRAVHEWDAVPDRGVVDQVTRGEVVGAVGDPSPPAPSSRTRESSSLSCPSSPTSGMRTCRL